MTRGTLARRCKALKDGEGGFTIVESMIAITLLFAAIVAMMYTATIGFKSIAFSRERVTANGIANRIMEEIRGQAYARIQTGLNSSDLTGDPNIKSCGGSPVVYRFESCSAPTGEKIVHSSGVPSEPWINPHSGTIAASSVTNDLAYAWKTYITNNCPAVETVTPCHEPHPLPGDRPRQLDERGLPQPPELLREDPESVLLPERLCEFLDPPVRGSVPALLLRDRAGASRPRGHHGHDPGLDVRERVPAAHRHRIEPPERTGHPGEGLVHRIARLGDRRGRDARGRRCADDGERGRLRPWDGRRSLRHLPGHGRLRWLGFLREWIDVVQPRRPSGRHGPRRRGGVSGWSERVSAPHGPRGSGPPPMPRRAGAAGRYGERHP